MMSNTAEFIFWDVQHGHATYIKSPNNRHIVVDLGTGSYGLEGGFSPLMHLKNNYGVEQLDYVIITHPHKDHIDDIFSFDSLSPKVLQRPKHLADAEVLEGVREKDMPQNLKYLEISKRYNSSVSGGSNDPAEPENYGGLKIKTFVPSSCGRGNLNNHSVVSVFEYAGLKVVIPGDNESCSWDELLKLSAFKSMVKNADVLLAPHHGRKSGFHIDAVNLINPRITVVSDGRFCDTSSNSRYGEKSRGWNIYSRKGGSKKRYCLTTNSDGDVKVRIGQNVSENKPFLDITIN